MKGEVPGHAPTEVYFDGNLGRFVPADGKPFPERKQNLSDVEIGQQNIRGYAGLVQEMYDMYDNTEVSIFPERRKNLARPGNNIKNPLAKIELDPTKTRDLVEGLETALAILAVISSRQEQAIRLRFRLDKPAGDLMPLKNVALRIPSYQRDGMITEQAARYLVNKGIKRLRFIATHMGLTQRLWEDQVPAMGRLRRN